MVKHFARLASYLLFALALAAFFPLFYVGFTWEGNVEGPGVMGLGIAVVAALFLALVGIALLVHAHRIFHLKSPPAAASGRESYGPEGWVLFFISALGLFVLFAK
jgi:hypothetical protein